VIYTEIETTIINIAESYYLRMPPSMVKYFKLTPETKAVIRDIDSRKVEVVFSGW